MKCPTCNGKTKHYDSEYDYSKESGIEGITFTVDTYYCKPCDFEFYDFGDMEEVNDEIAKALMGATTLRKEHIKFIRKHFFDENVFQFAKRISCEPQVLRMLEKGPSMNIHCRRLTDKVKDAVLRHWAERNIEIKFDIE